MSEQMLNQVSLIGRMIKDPEMKRINDKRVAKTTIAVEKKANEGEKGADFIQIVCWNKKADRLVLGKKGSLVSVEGRMRSSTYEKDGERKYSIEVQADHVRFLEKVVTNTSE